MKILHFCLLLAALGVSPGCYSPRQYALQPGETVIFRDSTRANDYRQQSGNDAQHAGRVVEITRPTRLSCE